MAKDKPNHLTAGSLRCSLQDTPQTTPHTHTTTQHKTQHTTHKHNTTRHNTTQHNTTQHNMTQYTTLQQHDHNTTRRQRDTDKEDREREERRFIFSVVVHDRSSLMECFFWLTPFCARDLSLLNSVKCDCSLISFSASWQVDSFFEFCELSRLCSYSFQFSFFELSTYAVTVSNFSELFFFCSYSGGMEKQWRDPSHREEEYSEDSDNTKAETWYYKEELVGQNNKVWAQPLAHGASSSVDWESQKSTEAKWDHYLHISPNTSHCLEAVFSMVRKIYGKPPGDPVEDLNVNLAIW